MDIVIYNDEAFLLRKDEQFMHIQNMIDAKKRMLLEKQKKIKQISKQNCFLDEVKNDYMRYYSYIHQQKRDQMKALEMLNNYVSDLEKSGEISKQNMNDAKEEQRKILHEMKLIKESLDKLMNDTEHLSDKLKDKTQGTK